MPRAGLHLERPRLPAPLAPSTMEKGARMGCEPMTEQSAATIKVSVVPKDDGWNVFAQRPGYPLVTLNLPTVEDAHEVIRALTDAIRDKARDRPGTFTVHFQGGPWDGQTTNVERIVAPVFAVGHMVGNHYYLGTKSDPPTYFWDGTPWERKAATDE